MHHTFGARLRSQREERQVSLNVIAEQSKIRVSLLEGLERDDVSHWPGGIFRRSYVRTYAQAIGLDPDAVVREFLELFPDPVEEDPANVIAAARGVSPTPPTRLGLLLGSAFEALPGRRAGPSQPIAPRQTESPAPPRQFVEERRTFNEPAAVQDDAPLVETRHELDRPREFAVEPLVQTELPAEEPVTPVVQALERLADVCARLAGAVCGEVVADAFADAACALDAAGLILWVWDPDTRTLTPALAHGYSDRVVARLPRVGPRDENPVASAYRDSASLVIDGAADGTCALVVPVVNCDGCVGVLALELRAAGERIPLVRAMASLLAAQLATLVSPVPSLRAASA